MFPIQFLFVINTRTKQQQKSIKKSEGNISKTKHELCFTNVSFNEKFYLFNYL